MRDVRVVVTLRVDEVDGPVVSRRMMEEVALRLVRDVFRGWAIAVPEGALYDELRVEFREALLRSDDDMPCGDNPERKPASDQRISATSSPTFRDDSGRGLCVDGPRLS